MKTTSLSHLASDYALDSVVHDEIDPVTGLRILVVRGGYSFCAYVGLKDGQSPTSSENLSFDAPREITLREWGAPGTFREAGWFWWGWHYGHAGDYLDLVGSEPEKTPEDVKVVLRQAQELAFGRFDLKNWTLGEVLEEAAQASASLNRALRPPVNAG